MERKQRDEDLKEIAVWIGGRVAEIAAQMMPRVAAGLLETDKKIEWSVKVTSVADRLGTISCTLRTSPPKIPTADVPDRPFVMQIDHAGQLAFLFDGTADELARAVETPLPDGYAPDDNAKTLAEAGLEPA